MHIVYKLTFKKRKELGILPYLYIGSKSNCTIKNGAILDKSGRPYYGSCRKKDYKDIVKDNINDIEVEVLGEFNSYNECLQYEKYCHIDNDCVASTLYFNSSIATESNYANPDYATYKHNETGKVVRLPRDHKLVLSGEYVGVTKGRSVKNDPGHNNRKLKGELNPFYGKAHSDEAIKKIKDAREHQEFTEETRKKMSESRKGIPKSEEHKKKIGRKKLVMLKNILTGECVRIHKDEMVYYDLVIWKNPCAIKQKRMGCIYCGKESVAGMIHRWHNENCKHKEDHK